MSKQSVTVRAPAKINLQLSVGGARPDGYHELATVFQAVSLYDEVTATRIERSATSVADQNLIAPQIEVTIAGTQAVAVPTGSSNLAAQAALLLARTIGDRMAGGPRVIDHTDRVMSDDDGWRNDRIQRNRSQHDDQYVSGHPTQGKSARSWTDIHIHIDKNIPVAGGMAGGSADAAATLVACNELWEAGFSLDQLCELAAQLGSDVPFPLRGGTAIGTGRGEHLQPIRCPGPLIWVIATSDKTLSTPAVFAKLDQLRGEAATPDLHINDTLLSALASADIHAVAANLHNDLQPAAIALLPELEHVLATGTTAGALAGIVSGSGPTTAFLVPDDPTAAKVQAALSQISAVAQTWCVSSPTSGVTLVH